MKDIISIFRPKRWYQNIIVIAGAILAAELLNLDIANYYRSIAYAFAAVCLVASGNYGINEVLDAESDSHHPEKQHRAVASGRISKSTATILSIALYITGFAIILNLDNWRAGLVLFLFFLGAVLYNVSPFRFKDRPYLDFIFEAVNSPLRILLGWYVVADKIFPSSFIIAVWFLGIFLMAAKRFGDIRLIKDKVELASYRKSQRYYTEERLLIAMIASLSVFYYMLGALCMKYSIDLIVTLPFIVLWTAWFFKLAYEENTVIKDP